MLSSAGMITTWNDLETAIAEVGRAVRRPEELAVRWRDRGLAPADAPTRAVFTVLLLTAMVGLAAYGATMGIHAGLPAMLRSGFRAPLSAGIAWTMALPALYIINSASGSKLDMSTTLLAALITVSFGALSMLAGVPVNWFFTLALPWTFTRVVVNMVIFGGVAVAMADTFLRVMRALEPQRSVAVPLLWLGLLGAIGNELMLLLDVFDF